MSICPSVYKKIVTKVQKWGHSCPMDTFLVHYFILFEAESKKNPQKTSEIQSLRMLESSDIFKDGFNLFK